MSSRLRGQSSALFRNIEAAWAEFSAIQKCRISHGFPPLLYDRTKSNDIFDSIARLAIHEFGADDAFMVKIEAQTFKLFHKGCCIRFKKGGADLLGRNIPTQSALAFMDAEGQLPGMPPDTAKLEIVWVANELFTELKSIHVVARDGDELIWEYPVDRASDVDNVTTLPIQPVEPDDDDGDTLVTPKKDRVSAKERD